MTRLYRVLLHLFPRAFRERFGEGMQEVLSARLRETLAWGARARIWVGAFLDLALHAPLERWAKLTGGAGRDRPVTLTSHPGRVAMDGLAQDLRYAMRSLRGDAGFTLAALLTLALGIGANVATFSVVNSVLLRPLPYPEAERLVSVWPAANFNGAMVRAAAEGVPALEAVSGYSRWLFTLTGEGDAIEVQAALVTPNHFRVLRMPSALGRTFLDEEGLPGRGDVAVLSHDFWISRFGGDPSVVGRRIRLSGAEHDERTVIGVLPADHRPVWGKVAVWAPLELDAGASLGDDPTWYVNDRLGRLSPGASVEQASQQMRATAVRIQEAIPDHFEPEEIQGANVESLKSDETGSVGATLWLLLGAVGLVLLIACSNVANLLLSRGEGRTAELVVRRAVGARPSRLFRQLLTEAVVLGALGALAGIALSYGLVAVILGLAPADFPRLDEVSVDRWVLLFTLGVATLAVLLFGTLPAWRAVRSSAQSSAGGAIGARGGSRRRSSLSRALVSAEVALALFLIAGAGLMVRTLSELGKVDPGFRSAGVLALRVSPPESRYPTGEVSSQYYRALMERVAAVPGVADVGGIHLLPMESSNWAFPTFPEGVETPEGQPNIFTNFRAVLPGYFETMGIPLAQGRLLGVADVSGGPPSALVNRAFADEHWPGQEALGKQVRLFSADARPWTVVGVVGDVRQFGLTIDALPEFYVTAEQWGSTLGQWIVVRGTGDEVGALSATVREAVQSIDADVAISRLGPLDQIVRSSVAGERFFATLLGFFGALALVLGAVGVYAVTAYSASRRRRDFGIRMALGAGRVSILAASLRQEGGPVVVGLAIGLVAALSGGRLLQGVMYGVGPRDPLTLTVVACLLGGVALTAMILPTWGATRMDPMGVLREE